MCFRVAPQECVNFYIYWCLKVCLYTPSTSSLAMFVVVNGSCFAASLQMANPQAGRVEQSRDGPRQSPEPDSPEKLDANNAKKCYAANALRGMMDDTRAEIIKEIESKRLKKPTEIWEMKVKWLERVKELQKSSQPALLENSVWNRRTEFKRRLRVMIFG